jgi:ribosomal protein S18 acetylase RimI-like enzyme
VTPTLRLATPADAGRVAALMGEAYAPSAAVIGRRPAPMDDDYAARIAAGAVHVAMIDGRLVGAAVLLAQSDALWLETVAVAPEWQGRGIGRRLIELAEGEAARRGLARLRLYTNAAMTANRALYPRLGYRETGRAMQAGFDRVFFEKPVEPST